MANKIILFWAIDVVHLKDLSGSYVRTYGKFNTELMLRTESLNGEFVLIFGISGKKCDLKEDLMMSVKMVGDL